jgi:hypothetical protein
MTTGIVESGRRVAIGRGRTAGACTSFGIGTAVGSAIAVGTGSRFGSGRALGIAGTSGGIVIAGTCSGEATGGSVGNGPSVAAASGARGEAVHATDAISAKRTSVRTLRISPHQRVEQVSGHLTVRAT